MKFLLSIFLLCCGSLLMISGQTPKQKKYIDSFKEYKSKDILNAGKIVQYQNPMSKEEALTYVYKGDTAKLFCYQKIINMETEKVEGISREIYFPNKCLRIDMGNYFLLAYSSYQCKNPNEALRIMLSLSIVNKQYQIMDNILIYKGTDYGQEFTGLINPNNGKIFLYGDIKGVKRNDAVILKINPLKFKFEKTVEADEVEGDIDDLNSTIKVLGWLEVFNNL